MGAMRKKLNLERERERERERESIRHRKEENNEVQCMNKLHAKENCIMGKNLIQNTAFTRYNQLHNPRMYETLL